MKRIIFLTAFIPGLFLSKSIGQSKNNNPVWVQDKKAVYEIPAVYELMNIAFAITDTNNYSGNLNIYYNIIDTSTAYYKEVVHYFSNHKKHKLITALNKQLKKSYVRYLYNLQKGYNSNISDNEIRRKNKFPLFLTLQYGFQSVKRSVIEDFAKASDFQSFYENHRFHYQQILDDAKQKLSLTNIQQWLENEFSKKYDTFKIVISPLMRATHFTKRFSRYGKKISIMWVSDGSGYDPKRYTQTQIAGLYTGVVFTEIDHNYVNPASNNFKKDLNQIMGNDNRPKWIKADGDGKFYSSGYKIFNEYMTHAVYLIYTNTVYSKEDQTVIENSRIKLMEDIRKYYRFKDFYTQLKTLYASKKEGENITGLYPAMLDWCKKQQ